MAKSKKKKTKDRYAFDRGLIRFIYHAILPWLSKKWGVVKTKTLTLPEGPCVVLYNHTMDLDVVWAQYMFKTQMYCVASEHIVRKSLGGKLVKLLFAPILMKKGTNGSSVVMEMHRHLKKGHHILLSPEGVRSGNGLTAENVPSTAAVLRKLKCNVVVIRSHGGYFTSPRWADSRRKGLVTIEKVAEYTPAQIAAMSVEEFDAKIAKDIYEDAYAYNGEKKIVFRGKNLAQSLELQLGICPVCHQFGTIHSKKNDFACSCGMKGSIDEYGMLSGEKLPFKTVTEWDHWIDEYIRENLPKWKESGEVICKNSGQELIEILADHKDITKDTGDLSLTAKAIRVGETLIALDTVSELSFYSYGILLINTTDRHYYEINGAKYPGIIYYKIIKQLSGRPEKHQTRED